MFGQRHHQQQEQDQVQEIAKKTGKIYWFGFGTKIITLDFFVTMVMVFMSQSLGFILFLEPGHVSPSGGYVFQMLIFYSIAYFFLRLFLIGISAWFFMKVLLSKSMSIRKVLLVTSIETFLLGYVGMLLLMLVSNDFLAYLNFDKYHY